MAEYRTILVGLDFSDDGRHAIERAAQLARLFGSVVYLAHIIEHFPEDLPVEMIAPEDRDPAKALSARIREKALELARETGLEGARVLVETTHRSARHRLLELAESTKPDLIIAGGSGEAGLGSTASGLVHRAPCDVLIVHG